MSNTTIFSISRTNIKPNCSHKWTAYKEKNQVLFSLPQSPNHYVAAPILWQVSQKTALHNKIYLPAYFFFPEILKDNMQVTGMVSIALTSFLVEIKLSLLTHTSTFCEYSPPQVQIIINRRQQYARHMQEKCITLIILQLYA